MLQLSQHPGERDIANQSRSSPVSRLRGWIEVHVDARVARSLGDFREGELARAVAMAREGDRLRGARLEAMLTSLADAQARLLTAVEEISQDLVRVGAAAAIQQESAAQEELLLNFQKLVESVDELQQNLTRRESDRDHSLAARLNLHDAALADLQRQQQARTAAGAGAEAADRDNSLVARLHLHDAVLADLQRHQQLDVAQREAVLSSAELLWAELKTQRVELANLHQELGRLQKWSRQLPKQGCEGGRNVQAQVDELAGQLRQVQNKQLEVSVESDVCSYTSTDQELVDAWKELKSVVTDVPSMRERSSESGPQVVGDAWREATRLETELPTRWDKLPEGGQQDLLDWLESSQARLKNDLGATLRSHMRTQQRASSRRLAESFSSHLAKVEERLGRHLSELSRSHSELCAVVTGTAGGGVAPAASRGMVTMSNEGLFVLAGNCSLGQGSAQLPEYEDEMDQDGPLDKRLFTRKPEESLQGIGGNSHDSGSEVSSEASVMMQKLQPDLSRGKTVPDLERWPELPR